MLRKLRAKYLVIALVLFLSSVAVPRRVAAQDSECAADVTAELVRTEPGEEGEGDHYTWEVTATTEADCAVVTFKLNLAMQTPDGEDASDNKMGQVKISDGSETEQVLYQMKPGYSLVSWTVEKRSCNACDLEHPD